MPAPPTPRASVVIPAWRNARHLSECIAAVRRQQTALAPFETIVVLNGATDDVVATVADIGGDAGDVRVVTSEVNLGFGGGCNLGVAAARGEYLVFLNDDAAPEDGWLEALVETAEDHPEAGAVGSRIVSPDGLLLEAGSVLWREGLTSHVGRGLLASSSSYRYLRQVDYCSGSSLLVRRSTWDRLGGFDEAYFPGYYEDVDLCLSIARLGQTILYEPRSVVRHWESASLEWGSSYKEFVARRSRARFLSKWSEELSGHLPSAPHLEAAVHFARKLHLRALVVDDDLVDGRQAPELAPMLARFLELTARGYAVAFFLGRGWTGAEELGRAGIDVVVGELADHLCGAEVLYDVVFVSGVGQLDAVSGLVRRRQPQAAIVCCGAGPQPAPTAVAGGLDADGPEVVVGAGASPAQPWSELAEVARRERLARLTGSCRGRTRRTP